MLRSVFGQNLALLLAGETSVAAFCRQIGVNRTQFHRYLSGEAFPRPDLLDRICRHFNTDARILLEPLDAIRARSGQIPAGFAELMRNLPGWPDVSPDTTYLPDGIYRVWRGSFALPDKALVTLARISRVGGVATFRATEPHIINPMIDAMPSPTRCRIAGVVMRTADGIALPCAIRDAQILRWTYLRQGFSGIPTLYGGFSALSRDKIRGLRRFVPTMVERVGPGFRTQMAAARSTGYRNPDELPPLLSSFIFDEPLDF